jgi:hypothetical protein
MSRQVDRISVFLTLVIRGYFFGKLCRARHFFLDRKRPNSKNKIKNLRGEIAFRTLADRVRYAKNPMVKRIGGLDAKIPIWFIYGSDTWLDKAGYEVKKIRGHFSEVFVKVFRRFFKFN